MLKNLPSSIRSALLLTIVIVAYFGIGTLLSLGEDEQTTKTIVTPLPRVVTMDLSSSIQEQKLDINGRTKAKRAATLRAETAGLIIETPIDAGTPVKKGQLICKIDPGTRSAGLAEAEAAFQKAKIDYDAAIALSKEGFSSDAAVASAEAAFNLSRANLTRARTDFSKTRITAPFDGILTQRPAEVGDLLSLGGTCATVAQINPIVISAAVSEQEVIRLKEGTTAAVTVSNGVELDATLTMIAATASQATRTFMIELEAENTAGLLDGLTATAQINIGEAPAHLIPRNALIRNDEGILGVRAVTKTPQSNGGVVKFAPVSVLGDDSKGIWVAGLSDSVALIVRGQDYVRQGQEVEIAKPGETTTPDENEG